MNEILTHNVVDSDVLFTVNAFTRAITTDKSQKTVIMQGDHNSERFTFEIPRYIEGHDMYACNSVQVYFLNIENNKKGDNNHRTGVYTVTDLQLSPDKNDTLICSWLISKNATTYAGILSFMLRLSCMTEESIEYRWNTDVYSDIHVVKGLNGDLAFEAEYVDIIEQWKVSLKTEMSMYIDSNVNRCVAAAQESIDNNLQAYISEVNANLNTSVNELSENLNGNIEELREYITENVNTFDDILQKEITDMSAELDTQKARMDTFTALPDGSTTGDAELADIRVGADGTTYENAGTAVREQFNKTGNDVKATQTIFTNILPTLKENTRVNIVNGAVEESAEILDARIVSNTNYGSYYINRYISPGTRKLIILQKVKIISGDASNQPHVYCYGSDNRMIDGAKKIQRGSMTFDGVEYFVNCVNLVDDTVSIGIGCYSMKETGICEVDTNPIVFDVSHLSDDVISELYNLLCSGYLKTYIDDLHGNVPYYAYYSDEAKYSDVSEHSNHAYISDSAHSCYLAKPPIREVVTEANDWTSTVTPIENGFNVIPKENWGGIGLIRNFIIGMKYLVIWQGSFADKVGFVKSSGSAWNHVSSKRLTIGGTTQYYYGCVEAMEDDLLNRILLHTAMDADATIFDVTVTEIDSNIDITEELVKSIILGETIYIPSMNKEDIVALQNDMAEIKPKAHAHGWKGKNVLFMGDSLTAARQYQDTIVDILGIEASSHCLGGAGIIQIVDGNNEGTIDAITADMVKDKDLIVFYAGYNNRGVLDGSVGDCYPEDRTIAGYMQYAINRIYECLAAANNLTCKLLIVTVDCAGKYDYIDADGYEEYPAGSGQSMETMANIQKAVSEYNSIPCCDLWHNSGINRNTWSIFGANPNAYIENPGDSSAPYPHNGDQLHKSKAGYVRIGEVIAGAIIKAYGN